MITISISLPKKFIVAVAGSEPSMKAVVCLKVYHIDK
jgi:hypothetical protein